MDGILDNSSFHTSFGHIHDHAFLGDWFSALAISHFQSFSHEYNLPDDVVKNAVHSACDFLHMNDLEIKPDIQTGIYTHDPTTMNDDELGFSRKQLLDMGVHDENTLSLICTHEAAHSVLQYLSSTHELSRWQEELSCDTFMGVRAAIEGIDTQRVVETLRNTTESETHPYGDLRVKYVEIGKQIGEELKSHDIPVTVDNIMSRLDEHFKQDAQEIYKREAIVNEIINQKNKEVHFADSEEQKGYTRAEINRNISKARMDMLHEESQIRHCEAMIRSKISAGDPYNSYKYELESASHRYKKAKDDLWKWEHMQADEQKGIINLDINDSESFHSYSTISEVNRAQAEADYKHNVYKAKNREMERCRSQYGTDSYEYRKAKSEFDKAESEFKEAKANYEQTVKDLPPHASF